MTEAGGVRPMPSGGEAEAHLGEGRETMVAGARRYLTWTRVAGAAIFMAAAVLCAINMYFIVAHPQGCRWLTIPLIGTLLLLGFINWRWQLLLFVFLTPLLYWLPTMEDGVRLRLARMMFPFVLVFWGARLLSPSAAPLPATRLRRPLGLYIGLVLLSGVLTLWRYYPLLNWDTVVMVAHELVEANRDTFWAYFRPEFCIARETVVYVTGPLFLLLLLHSGDAALLSRLRTVLLCSLPAAASVAVWQKLTGAKSLQLGVLGREGLERVHGTLGDANTFAAYLALLLLPLAAETALCWWPCGRSGTTSLKLRGSEHTWTLRAATLASMLLALLALIWTVSRAAWIGTGVALAVAARACSIGAAERLGLPRLYVWKRLQRYTLVGALSLGLILLMLGWLKPRPYSEWRSPSDATVGLFATETLRLQVRDRWIWWEPALRMGTELPLTGVGVGNYRLFASPYWPGPQLFGILGDPHNYDLKPFSELGVLGFGLFLWICWSVRQSWRAPPLQLEQAYGLRRLAVGAGLLALAVDMLFQHALVQSEMQVITAAVVTLAVLDERGCARLPARTTRRRSLTVVAAAAAGIAVLWAGRYRGSEVHPVSPATMVKWGATPNGSDVYLRGSAGLRTTIDQKLGRALVVVTARAQKVGDRWPRLMLTVNGDYIGEWSIDSATTKAFKRLVFTIPGPNSFQLRLLGYYRDPQTGEERSVEVGSLAIFSGHMASYVDRHDP